MVFDFVFGLFGNRNRFTSTLESLNQQLMRTGFGQTTLAAIPLRGEASHRSEMVSQLLYNETYTILEEFEDWVRVECLHDGYEGWLPKNQVHYISQEEFDTPFQYYSPDLLVWDKELEQHIFMGSPFYELAQPSLLSPIEQICKAAQQFLNVPYLWGGRSPLGVDCSGLMQVVFRIGKILLPRDASQQPVMGKKILWGEHQRGDLAFFENEQGKIVHVGLIWGPNQILHASAWVRIDELNEHGIIHQGQQTHQLAKIKRVLV